MATRLYFPSSGVPLVTPSTWNFGAQINPLSLKGGLVKTDGTPMTTKLEATGTTNPTARAMFRWVYGPMAAQTLSGTVKAQIRGLESTTGGNASPGVAIKFIKPDGTDRAVLLAQTAADSATAGHEFSATTLTNQKFEDSTETTPLTLSSQACLDGDYLVIEVGFRSATSTTRNISLSHGNDSATDLAEDNTTTTANNPWIEFSQTLNFFQPVFDRHPERETGPFPFPRTTPPFVPTSMGDVTTALSGVAATIAIGTLTALASFGLAGQVATGNVSLGPPTTDVAMTGVIGTVSPGTETPGFSFSLSGLGATTAVGTVSSPGWSLSLVGVSGAMTPGALTPGLSEAITGVGATSAVGTETPGEDIPLTGVVGTSGLGVIVSTGGTSSNLIERPRVVRGPFPFPKEVPAFFVQGVQPSAALTGVEATCNADNALILPSSTVALSGVSAVGQAGVLQASSPGSASLNGVVGTSALGTLTPAFILAPVGNAAVGAAGLVVPSLQTFNRPISVYGPAPFLPSALFQFRERPRFVQGPPIGSSGNVFLIGLSASANLGSLAVGVVSVTMTGVAATASVGAEKAVNAPALIGASATGSVGSLGLAQTLVGAQATGVVGSEAPSIDIGLMGVEASGVLGAIAAQSDSNVTIGLVGVAASANVGALTPGFSLAETGVNATTAIGSMTGNEDIALVGLSAQGALGNLAASGSGAAALAGLQASASLGAVDAIASRMPVGVEATGGIGVLSADVVVALSGVAATGHLGAFTLGAGSFLDFVGEYNRTLDFVGEFE